MNSQHDDYTQDTQTQRYFLRSSFDGISDTTTHYSIDEQAGLQHIRAKPAVSPAFMDYYQTSTSLWLSQNSSWMTISQPKATTIPLSNLLSTRLVKKYFDSIVISPMRANTVTLTLHPNVAYDTQVLDTLRSYLLPGSTPQPKGTVWDLTIQIKLQQESGRWIPVSDVMDYTWTDIRYLSGAYLVGIMKLHDNYAHDAIPVSLPNGASKGSNS